MMIANVSINAVMMMEHVNVLWHIQVVIVTHAILVITHQVLLLMEKMNVKVNNISWKLIYLLI